jgi:hypothetical protein
MLFIDLDPDQAKQINADPDPKPLQTKKYWVQITVGIHSLLVTDL